ncbi:MAG: nuclear transport factor 2 family protein [Solirubrobacterales bacterium]
MAANEAKDALLGALSSLLDGDRDMGEMETTLPVLAEYLRLFAASSFVCAMVPTPPTPAIEYEGVDGVVSAWRDWGAAFASVRAEAEDLFRSEDATVLFVNQIAVTRHGGVEMTQPSAMLWVFEDGLVARLEFHLDREAALRAGGLEAAGQLRPNR